MILQALTAYYEQLLKQGKVEAPGWDSKFKVSYEPVSYTHLTLPTNSLV